MVLGHKGALVSTFGPDFMESRDGERIRTGLLRVRNCLLAAAIRGEWLTIDEIKARIEAQYHTTISWGSVDADVRHLRKDEFGNYDVRRDKRGNISAYRIFAPVKLAAPVQGTLLEIGAQNYREDGR